MKWSHFVKQMVNFVQNEQFVEHLLSQEEPCCQVDNYGRKCAYPRNFFNREGVSDAFFQKIFRYAGNFKFFFSIQSCY